jgi:pyruvate dehydrogenase (quinone)
LVESLKNAGVKRIYCLPGDLLDGFTDALRETAPWSGSTYATRRLQPSPPAQCPPDGLHCWVRCKLRSGNLPLGNLPLIDGLFDCHRSRVPVLALAAHIPSTEIGINYFQETRPQRAQNKCG